MARARILGLRSTAASTGDTHMGTIAPTAGPSRRERRLFWGLFHVYHGAKGRRRCRIITKGLHATPWYPVCAPMICCPMVLLYLANAVVTAGAPRTGGYHVL